MHIKRRGVNLRMAEKILIVEDEAKIARFVSLELEHEGYKTETSHDGRQGLELALRGDYDLVILDLMLPGMNGLDILKALKAEKDTPVLILTARDQIIDKVNGLDIGADDYMTKPFAIEELFARIRNLIKRKEVQNGRNITVDKLNIGLNEHSVTYDGHAVNLTKKEYDLLIFLLKNRNNVVTREKILSAVWGYDFYGDTNVVDVYIRYIRSKIDDKYGIKLITTLRGTGYIIKEVLDK